MKNIFFAVVISLFALVSFSSFSQLPQTTIKINTDLKSEPKSELYRRIAYLSRKDTIGIIGIKDNHYYAVFRKDTGYVSVFYCNNSQDVDKYFLDIEKRQKEKTFGPFIPKDCSKWLVKSYDKVQDVTIISGSKGIALLKDNSNQGIGIKIMQFGENENEVTILFNVVGGGNCIDEGAKAAILFTDESRAELFNEADFNCENRFTVYLGGSFGKEEELKQLRTKKIETIRIWTYKSYVQEDFTTQNQSDFMNILNCISQ